MTYTKNVLVLQTNSDLVVRSGAVAPQPKRANNSITAGPTSKLNYCIVRQFLAPKNTEASPANSQISLCKCKPQCSGRNLRLVGSAARTGLKRNDFLLSGGGGRYRFLRGVIGLGGSA